VILGEDSEVGIKEKDSRRAVSGPGMCRSWGTGAVVIEEAEMEVSLLPP